jgi:hypothetical protein
MVRWIWWIPTGTGRLRAASHDVLMVGRCKSICSRGEGGKEQAGRQAWSRESRTTRWDGALPVTKRRYHSTSKQAKQEPRIIMRARPHQDRGSCALAVPVAGGGRREGG